MDGFESWDEFGIFRQAVEQKARYVLDERSARFIRDVIQTSEKRRRMIRADTIFWRAQIANGSKPLCQRTHRLEGEGTLIIDDEIVEIIGTVPTAVGKERMTPRRDKAKEGRINPKGIACLYVAEDKETAMGEQRPWIRSLITVATFKAARNLSIIDCTLDYEPFCQYDEEPGVVSAILCKRPAG